MGGPGSSRWPRRYVRRPCVDDAPPRHQLAAPRWEPLRPHELAEWETGGPHELTPLRWSLHEKQAGRRLPLSTVTRDGGRLELRTRFNVVTVEAIPQTVAGRVGLRWWALCPGCDRRCAALWIRGLNSPALCRTCHGVKYAAQRLAPIDRTTLRTRRLASRLAGRTWHDDDQPPPKPKRMHWQRYARLVAQWERAADEREGLRDEAMLRGFARFCPGPLTKRAFLRALEGARA